MSKHLNDNEFDDLFKDAFDQYEPTPPNDDKVWEKVERKLPYSLLLKRPLDIITKAAAIFIIMLLGVHLYNINFGQQHELTFDFQTQTDYPVFNETGLVSIFEDLNNSLACVTQNKTKPYLFGTLNNDFTNTIIPENYVEIISNQLKPISSDKFENIALNSIKETEELLSEAKTIAEKSNSNNLAILGSEENENEMKSLDEISGQEVYEMNKSKQFYINADAMVVNSWMLSKDLEGELATGKEIDKKFTTSLAYNTTIGLQITPKLAIETGISFAKNKQKYYESVDFQAYNKTIEQKIIEIPVGVKFSKGSGKLFGKSTSLNYRIGAYYGMNQSSELTIMTTSEENLTVEPYDVSHLKSNYLGVYSGVNYEMALNKKVSLYTGLKTSFDSNTMLKKDTEPMIHNLKIGIGAGLKYNF